MSKKRKQPPQSNTLLNFLTPGANGLRVPLKAKRRAETFINGSKAPVELRQVNKAEVEDGPNCVALKPQDTDIIVIESDDEDEVEAYLVDDSSEVEVIVESQPGEQATDTQSRKRDSQDGTVSRQQPERSPLDKRNSDKEDFVSEQSIQSARNESDEWDLALEEDLDTEYLINDLPEHSCEDVATKMEDSEEAEVTGDDIASCPLCRMTFLDFDSSEIQEHVNACLDASADPVAPPAAARTPLRPLSSFLSSRSVGPSSGTKPPIKTDLKPKPASAFSVLMSGNAERERAVWAEAQVAEDPNVRPTKTERRKAPFYKIITGMPIAVDAFRYGTIPGVEAYFLTHAHSDHYTNLSSNWKSGPIYCSETTANLIAHMLSVDRKWLHSLPMNTPVEVPNTGGVNVTLLDANHCPGSCLFLFEGPQTVNAGDSTYKSPFVGTSRTFRYLHCGDFRASPQHVLHPAVKGKRLDTVYLDTTYLNPRYCFPPQPLVVSACAELARRIVNGEPLDSDNGKGSSNGKASIQEWMKAGEGKGKQKAQEDGEMLVVVGTYSIGKERVVKAIAKALNTKVYCDSRKVAILHCQEDSELHALLTDKPLQAGVHVVPLGQVASDRFKEYMDRWKGRWSRAVAFRPTGWTYSPPAGSDPMPPISRVVAAAQARDFTYAHLRPARNSTTQLMQYGVPYSEHSSFAELACFALSVDCARIIATVNVGSAVARAKMQKWIGRWEVERKRRREAGLPAVVEYRNLEYW